MGKKIPIFLALMAILAIPAFGDGSITVSVSVNGTPHDGAYVGVRTAPNALTDVDSGSGSTADGGVFTTGTLANGTYYVAAFVDGYVAVEDSVTITDDYPSVNLNLTEIVTQNLVQSRHVPSTPGAFFGGSDCGDGSAPDYVNTNPAGGNTFVNGARADSTTNSGCWGDPAKTHIGVDLGADYEVKQALVVWWGGYGNSGPPYEIQYAVDNATSIPGLESTEWITWAGTSTDHNPFHFPIAGWCNVVVGTPVEARYWRIYSPATSALAIQEFELHSVQVPPADPGTISGTVTVSGGSLPTYRVIGIKPSSAATADADEYCVINPDGSYVSSVLPAGFYYVGVWADGYRMQETVVEVTAEAPTDCDFDLTDIQNSNLAISATGFGGVWGTDDVFYSVNGGQPNGGSGTFIDGYRGNGYTVAGDFRVGTGGGPAPGAMGIDLGADKQVDQMLIDWYYDGAWYWPRDGYKVQFALDGDDPGLGSTDWQDWYVYSGTGAPKPYGGVALSYEMITGAPTAARYWRIYAEDGYGWGSAVMLVQEWEVYCAQAGGKISGTVSVNGAPQPGAVIGLKSTPNAGADADVYFTTDGNGYYETAILEPGSTYYVAAWVDGYRIVEESVTISGNMDQDFNLTAIQNLNLAMNKLGFGGVIGPDGVDYGTNGGVPGYGGNNTFNNGTFDDYYTIVGDLRYDSGTAGPIQLGVDFGADKQVDQMVLDWYGGGYNPRGGYKIQYALDDQGGLPAIDSAAWQDWYVYVGAHPTPWQGNDYEMITGAPTAARWWRIYADHGWADGWNKEAFLVQEWQVYSAIAGGVISGTVTVDTVLMPDVVVGIKTSPSALADADQYVITDANGYYETGLLEAGTTYYVAAWLDGWRAVEYVVPVTTSVQQDLEITELQLANAAGGMPVFGDGIDFDGTPVTVSGEFVDGLFDAGYGWVGDRSESATHPHPMAMGVDCLVTRADVSQVFIDWYDDAGVYWPTSGYKVQYAVDTGGGIPAFDSPAWQDWYVHAGPTIPFNLGTPEVPEAYVVITGTPVSARYWRIRCEDSFSSWAGRPAFLVQEFQVYSPTPATLSIPRIKKLPDNAAVTVETGSVTLAPRQEGVRVGEFFYVEDPDRIAGIRVENPNWFGDDLDVNDTTSFTGILSTTASGERYIFVENEEVIGTPGSVIRPLGAITRSIQNDGLLGGQLIRVAGMVKEVAPDGSYFTIDDGYTTEDGPVYTRVWVVGDPVVVFADTMVTVTGTVSREIVSFDPFETASSILLREVQ